MDNLYDDEKIYVGLVQTVTMAVALGTLVIMYDDYSSKKDFKENSKFIPHLEAILPSKEKPLIRNYTIGIKTSNCVKQNYLSNINPNFKQDLTKQTFVYDKNINRKQNRWNI